MGILRFALALILAPLLSGGGDGAHDFDFELGTWNIAPGGNVHIVRPIWNGKASIAELLIERPAPHFAGSLLRLYDPQSRRWRIYWASSKDGSVDSPLVGAFENGRGEFSSNDVRVVYSDITSSSFRMEQSTSADGGKTWKPDPVQTFTRREPLPQPTISAKAGDHQHDFDFEFGDWRVHLRRLLHPLSGSTAWTDLDGTSLLYELWNGKANYGELNVANATSSIEGLTLRLYNPVSQQWSIYFVNSRAPELGTPVVGRFTGGRGEFYDRETFNGKPISVRFVFDDITPASFRFVQSFSADA
ncbi:MAG TPA: hypothetical protein VKE42_08575, partial [Candidatus Cybelea sp.]|nr:hypothetical protein [Candidatus Cybelea sp.]